METKGERKSEEDGRDRGCGGGKMEGGKMIHGKGDT